MDRTSLVSNAQSTATITCRALRCPIVGLSCSNMWPFLSSSRRSRCTPSNAQLLWRRSRGLPFEKLATASRACAHQPHARGGRCGCRPRTYHEHIQELREPRTESLRTGAEGRLRWARNGRVRHLWSQMIVDAAIRYVLETRRANGSPPPRRKLASVRITHSGSGGTPAGCASDVRLSVLAHGSPHPDKSFQVNSS